MEMMSRWRRGRQVEIGWRGERNESFVGQLDSAINGGAAWRMGIDLLGDHARTVGQAGSSARDEHHGKR